MAALPNSLVAAFPLAFAAGLVSFVSPCLLLLLLKRSKRDEYSNGVVAVTSQLDSPWLGLAIFAIARFNLSEEAHAPAIAFSMRAAANA
jgi:hypothetical protein